jgi:hypothetical protein
MPVFSVRLSDAEAAKLSALQSSLGLDNAGAVLRAGIQALEREGLQPQAQEEPPPPPVLRAQVEPSTAPRVGIGQSRPVPKTGHRP